MGCTPWIERKILYKILRFYEGAVSFLAMKKKNHQN